MDGESDGDDGGDEGSASDEFDVEDEDAEKVDLVAAHAPKIDEDQDPLESFMSDLDATEEIVPQGSINSLPSFNRIPTATTISLEDLMKLPSAYTADDGQEGEGWESDIRSEQTDDDGDDESHERDRAEFVKALRSLQAPEPSGSRDRDVAPAKPTPSKEPKELIDRRDIETTANPAAEKRKGAAELGRMFADEGDVMEEHEREAAERSALDLLQEAIKKKELAQVDHALIDYIKIRKNLYVVPRTLAHLAQPGSEVKLAETREALGIKVRGKGCPPPVETWEQCGLADRILLHLRKLYGEDTAPFAIQSQAVPTIMSGRDVIGIAKTGSGKTLAFLLPLFRHISDQPKLGEGEGPIGLILAPARELAIQIYNEAKKFAKVLNIRVTAVYGGAGVAEQIGELKRGAEIVVCTPGRMIVDRKSVV